MRPTILPPQTGALALLAAALLAGGCGDGPYDEDVRDQPALAALDDCAALERRIEDEAAAEMDAYLDEMIEQVKGGGGRAVEPALGTPTPAPSPDAATDFTDTNVQERGVDEADFVKTDGSRLFVLLGNRLEALAAWPPEDTRLLWSLPIEGEASEFFLLGGRLAVFSHLDLERVFAEAGLPWSPQRFQPGTGTILRMPCVPGRCGPFGLKVTVLDVSGQEPRLLREHYLEASYLTSRRLGSRVHVVASGPLRGPSLRWWPDVANWSNPEAVAEAFERLRAGNVRAIRDATLADWLPRRLDRLPGQAPRLAPAACGEVHATEAPVRLGFTSVLTLDLEAPAAEPAQLSVLNESGRAYASTEALYLTVAHRWLRPWKMDEVPVHTYLHRLSLAGPGRVAPSASGGVPGSVLDQFSMDEEGDLFRVATTDSDFRQATTTNGVYVLSRSGPFLRRVGELAGLAPGETIQSVRFEGDRGYMVTFRFVDPVFTLDLSDPARPRQVGELKIPGFSSYLHPLDRDHLLTIGRAGDASGRLFGLELKLFDVADMARPRVLHSLSPGTGLGDSEAAWDHRAFTYFASRGLLAIPFSDWGAARAGWRSTLEVFRVDLVGGILPVGSVDHAPLVEQASPGVHYSPWVRRGVMLEDFVYSISYGGVRVDPAGDLGRPVALVPFPPEG